MAPGEFDRTLIKAIAEASEGHKVEPSIHRHTCTVLISQKMMRAGTLQRL
jgi:hypothetical protein